MASSHAVIDCNQLNIALTSVNVLKLKRPSLQPVFGLSVLGFCRNMAVQDDSMKENQVFVEAKPCNYNVT